MWSEIRAKTLTLAPGVKGFFLTTPAGRCLPYAPESTRVSRLRGARRRLGFDLAQRLFVDGRWPGKTSFHIEVPVHQHKQANSHRGPEHQFIGGNDHEK